MQARLDPKKIRRRRDWLFSRRLRRHRNSTRYKSTTAPGSTTLPTKAYACLTHTHMPYVCKVTELESCSKLFAGRPCQVRSSVHASLCQLEFASTERSAALRRRKSQDQCQLLH